VKVCHSQLSVPWLGPLTTDIVRSLSVSSTSEICRSIFSGKAELSVLPNQFTITSEAVGALFVATTVVDVNVSDTHPIIKTVLLAVELAADDVCLTFTVWPFVTVPAAVVQAPPLMLYSPPVTEMAAAELMPETVMAADSMTVERATPV